MPFRFLKRPANPKGHVNGNDRRLFLEPLEDRRLLSAVSFSTPLWAVEPLGSLVYETSASETIATAVDSDTFDVNLDSGQTITLVVQPEAGLTASVELRDPTGSLLGAATGSGPGSDVVLQTISTTDAGNYIATVSGAGGTTGDFSIDLILNAAVEIEQHGGPNNNALASAQDLDEAFIGIGPGQAERAAVVGRAAPGEQVSVSSYTYDVDTVNNVITDGDASPDYGDPSALTDGVITPSSTGTAIYFTEGGIIYQLVGDEHPQPGLTLEMASPANLDRIDVHYFVKQNVAVDAPDTLDVTVNGDAVPQFSGFDNSSNTNGGGDARIASIDLAGYFGNSIHLDFRNFTGLLNSSGSWTGLSEIEVFADSGPLANDWYRFSMDDGEFATMILRDLSGGDVAFELYDATANLIVVSEGADDDSQTISDFRDTTSNTVSDIYYVRVTGRNDPYNLIITRNASFDTERNDDAETHAQSISATSAVLGGIRGDTPVPDVDSFTVDAKAGDLLTISTSTPFDDVRHPTNILDPVIDVFDSTGTLVATDDNSASDGHNALLSYNVTISDAYRIQVRPVGNSSGAYFLTIDGSSATLPLFEVTSSIPADQEFSSVRPTQVTIELIAPPRSDSVDAADLTINGQPATAVTLTGPSTAVFDIPLLSEGVHSIDLAAGSLLTIHGEPLQAFSANFTFSDSVPHVITSSILQGDVLGLGSLAYTATFSEALDDSDLTAADIQLVGQSAGQVTPTEFDYDAGTSTLTLEFDNLTADDYALTLISGNGHFEDLVGIPLDGDRHLVTTVPSGDEVLGGDFVVEFSVDGTAPRVIASSILEGGTTTTGPLVYTVQFDEPLSEANLSAEDIQFVGQSRGPLTPDAFDYDVGTSTLTLGFDSVPDDVYTLTLLSGNGRFEDVLGNDLDGEPHPTTTVPSGDAIAGGDFTVQFNIIVAGPQIIASSILEGDHFINGNVFNYIAVFDKPLDATAIDTSDVTLVGDSVGNVAPLSVSYTEATRTLKATFLFLQFDAYTLTLLSGDGHLEDPFGDDLDGERNPATTVPSGDFNPGGDFVVHFVLDNTAPRVIDSSVLEDDLLPVGPLVYTAQFDEPLDDSDLTSADIQLVGQSVGPLAPATFEYDQGTSTLTMEFDHLPEDDYTLTLLSGDGQFEDLVGLDLDGERHAATTVPSGNGNAGGDFSVTFSTDVFNTSWPLPLLAVDSPDGRIYRTSASATISAAADTDEFLIDLDEEQTVSVWVEPSGSLQPVVELRDPSGVLLGTGTATAAGEVALLQSTATTDAGTYSVTVSSGAGSSGGYSATLQLNAAAEEETLLGTTNDTLANAEDLASIFAPQGAIAQRAAVTGDVDFRQSIGYLDNLYWPNVVPFDFSDVPTAPGAAKLVISALGDLDKVIEFLTLDIEGQFSQDLFVDDGADNALVTTSLTIPAAEMATIAADGTVSISVTPNERVEDRWPSQLTIELILGIDIYQFALDDGQSVSAAMSGGGPDTATIEIFDAAGLRAASTTTDQGNQIVNSLTDDTSDGQPETYYAVVSGVTGNYGLVVAKDAILHAGAISTTGVVPDLTFAPRVLGHLTTGGTAAVDETTLHVTLGDELTITTSTPADGPGQFANELDPVLQLIDPSGVVVETDDNGADDSRNAELTHTATQSGVYTVRVMAAGGTQGEYLLEVGGHTASTSPFEVASTYPGPGAPVANSPSQIRVEFSDTIDPSSLQATDLQVDGQVAIGVTLLDGHTAVFDLAGAYNVGAHSIEISDGAVLDIQQTPLEILDSSFVVSEDLCGVFATDTVLIGGSNVVCDVTVPAGVTLTLAPGTELFFAPSTSLIVSGQLTAIGTPEDRITLRGNDENVLWGGVQFVDSLEDNVISYVDIDAAQTNSGSIGVSESSALIDHVNFSGSLRRYVRTTDSSLIVRNSVFPDRFRPGESPGEDDDNVVEMINGSGIMAGGHMIIEGNTFGTNKGHNDIIDFSGPMRPNPILQVLNNTFMGTADEMLDLGGDAYVEGNVFMHARRDAFNTSSGHTNVVSTGDGAPGGTIYLVRNVFYDIEHVIDLEDDHLAVLDNNTIVGITPDGVDPGNGTFQEYSVVNLVIVDRNNPGRGAHLDGNILFDVPERVFGEPDTRENGSPGPLSDLVVNNTLLPIDRCGDVIGHRAGTIMDLGTNILCGDPGFVDPAGDWHLQPGSPAIGAGVHELDLGAHVPAGATLSQWPMLSPDDFATFTVDGPGIVAYRYRTNGGDWGISTSVDDLLELTELADGLHELEVIGKNYAGVWQDEADAVTRSWTIDSAVLRPMAEDDDYAIDKGTLLNVNAAEGVLDNDQDVGNPLTAVLVNRPGRGTLTLNHNGSFTYQPIADFVGRDTFTYRADDGAVQSVLATVTIDVFGPAPLTEDDQYDVAEDELLTVDAATGLLANDVDHQGDDMTAVLDDDVSNGTLTLDSNGSFTYQPDEHFFGMDSFRYYATDNVNNSPSTLVEITVDAVNDVPVTVDDAYRYESGILARVGSVYAAAVLDDDPIGYWRLGEAAGSVTAEDVTGNHDGTYENFVGGDFSQSGALALDTDESVMFDGVDNLVTVPHSPDLAITGDLTVEFWMYKTAETPDWQRIVGKGSDRTRTFGLWEGPGNNKRILFQQYNGSGSIVTQFLSNSTIELNQWHHVVATVEGAATKIYIDGALDAQSTRNGTVGVDTEPLSFGKAPDMHDYFPGRLDEIALYNYALTGEEIEEHFGLGNTGVGSGSTSVLANDVDVEGSPLTAQLVDDAQNGTLNLSADGIFSYVPDPGFVGTDQFTYAAFDGVDESAPATVTIDVIPTGPIAGRHVFYNNSSLDGQDLAANTQDDDAIATGKWVLLPGQTISPGKVFAATHGINGLMVDIDGVGDAANLGPDDFVVRMGTGGDPSGWDVLELVNNERVPDVTVREGDGVGGSDRVTLTWPDGTLTNTYVQVTVLANARTGLLEPDIFYAASQVGDATGDRKVNASDLARILANWGTGTLPEQGDFDLTGTTGAADLAALFVGGGPLDDFTAPTIVAPPDAAQAVDAVIVQAIGPEPETDPIIGPIEFPLATTPTQTGRRLLRRIGRSFSHDAQPTDRQRLARQQAVDRVHEGELSAVDAEWWRSRRRRTSR